MARPSASNFSVPPRGGPAAEQREGGSRTPNNARSRAPRTSGSEPFRPSPDASGVGSPRVGRQSLVCRRPSPSRTCTLDGSREGVGVRLSSLIGGRAELCGPEATLSEAAQAMINASTGSLGVIQGRDLVGLITERDLLRAVAEGTDVSTASVGQWMSTEPDTVSPDVERRGGGALATRGGVSPPPRDGGRPIARDSQYPRPVVGDSRPGDGPPRDPLISWAPRPERDRPTDTSVFSRSVTSRTERIVTHTHHDHRTTEAPGRGGGHDNHAGHSVAMFRDRFWLSLAADRRRHRLLRDDPGSVGLPPPSFPGSEWVAPVLGTVVFSTAAALPTGAIGEAATASRE